MLGHLLRKTRIRTRLTVSLMIMCVFPVLVLSFFFYNSYQNAIYDRLSASTRQSLILYSTILDFHMGKCENISSGIMMDAAVQSALETQSPDELAVNPALSNAALRYFNNLFMWESYMKGFSIYGVNGSLLAEMGFVRIAGSELDELFSNFENSGSYKTWLFMQDSTNMRHLVLCRKVFSAKTLGKPLGYVLIYVDPEQLAGAINMESGTSPENTLKMIVESDNDRIVLYDDHRMDALIFDIVPDYSAVIDSRQRYVETQVAGVSSVVVVEEQHKTGWRILGVLPKAEISTVLQKTFVPLVIAVTLILMLGLAFASVIQRSIQKPINNIVNFTKDVALGDFSKMMNDDSGDEIGFLSSNIDSMVMQISNLFAKNQMNERKRHELELEILQYQINPHFLFNTLNSFQYIAELNGVKSISQGVANLCSVLKYTLYNTEAAPDLRQEINIVDAYLKIQELKFAGMFTVSYEVSPDSMDAQVIRFMLQPIVENSILHGFGNGELHIRVESRVDGNRLFVLVSDDGKGFDADESTTRKSKFSGIGLSNVRERLALQFGENCAFIVESNPGCGTRTRIEIPYIVGAKDVNSDD